MEGDYLPALSQNAGKHCRKCEERELGQRAKGAQEQHSKVLSASQSIVFPYLYSSVASIASIVLAIIKMITVPVRPEAATMPIPVAPTLDVEGRHHDRRQADYDWR